MDRCQEKLLGARDCKNRARFIVYLRDGREFRVCGVHIRWWRRDRPWTEIKPEKKEGAEVFDRDKGDKDEPPYHPPGGK